MPTITLSKSVLRKVVTESMREVLGSELMKLRALALPAVSSREQHEIEKTLAKADRTIGKRVRIAV